MTMESLPSILFQVGVEDMGDLEYIQEKVIAGNYFQVTGAINVLNDTISFVVPSGKTAFMIEAKIVITNHPSLSLNANAQRPAMIRAELKIDGTTKDTTNMGVNGDGSALTSQGGTPGAAGWGNIGDGKFNVLGLSLVGDNVKTIVIENTLVVGVTATATFSGYLV